MKAGTVYGEGHIQESTPGWQRRGRWRTSWLDDIVAWTGQPLELPNWYFVWQQTIISGKDQSEVQAKPWTEGVRITFRSETSNVPLMPSPSGQLGEHGMVMSQHIEIVIMRSHGSTLGCLLSHNISVQVVHTTCWSQMHACCKNLLSATHLLIVTNSNYNFQQ